MTAPLRHPTVADRVIYGRHVHHVIPDMAFAEERDASEVLGLDLYA